ncbi:Multisite-specific tRNA:(cytosine-C(5))-methyltransferase trm4b [Hypsizygus marmoreus]|uniref:Multisite-specific tRNA:(Cytosine-C(5))-methyltransferase trm4b n=1 Tax=Hypsizygus marmoreus TaxID=39966 RepID=A0A369J9D9_HYPMA|nr:Multisite-specific tRNA:(cytosine-C(5))-methyltransferase trm4b [Hypsizygus marmoreus]
MPRPKKRGSRKPRNGGGGGGGNKPSDDYRTDLIEKADMHNERFTSYYKAQGIVPEDEWDAFLDAMRQHLPTTFRVAGSRQIANTLNDTIKNVHVPSLSNVIFEDQQIPPPVQIPWYPDGLAWQFNVPKKVLRKVPEFKKFHSFLVFETEVGNVSRQEAVSMLPPLFLEVEPHHKVMDMCAAPGSKTAQLLEALHAQDSITATSIPTGLLLANDSDHKRTHLLIHQSARLPSPALMVTNLDASIYPIIKVPASPSASSSSSSSSTETQLTQLLFDRVLCDVPCSGDGTMRKNMGIWKSWQPMDGNGLHSLQVRILHRAVKLLHPSGRIVYSTCSLNPVENEAVVAEVLKLNPDFHLVDVSSKLPALKRRPGMTSWRPSVDKAVTTSYATYAEFLSSEDAKEGTKLTEGHWPPADVDSFNLPRCLRIYPHLQDTGGFFVAVLERKPQAAESSSVTVKKREAEEPEEVPETKKPRLAGDDEEVQLAEDDTNMTPIETEEKTDDSALATKPEEGASSVAPDTKPARSKQEKKAKDGGGGNGSFKEHPYTFLSPDDPILLNCMSRLSLTSAFPSSHVLVRNPTGDAVRSLYLANDLVKSVIQHNDFMRLRLTAAGTKVFSKQEGGKDKSAEAQFRVLGEGLPVILPFVDPKTIIDGDLATLKVLVQSYYPLCATFGEPFRGVVEARPIGSHVVRFPPGEIDGAVLTHEIVLPIWKSNVSLTLMMDKKAKSALSLRLFGADITTAGRDAADRKSAALESGAATPKEDSSAMEVVQESDLLDTIDES